VNILPDGAIARQPFGVVTAAAVGVRRLNRIFDQDSKHNIGLMVIASKEFAVFSKASGGSQD
jgi:hypothetical protein